MNKISFFGPMVCHALIRPNKKISVILVTGLKILGRIGTHIIFFWEKYVILCILKDEMPFKMHKIIYFPENLKKFKVSLVNLCSVGFFIWP